MNMHIMGAKSFQTSDPTELPNEASRLGPRHKPTGHATSACLMHQAITGNGLEIIEQNHVVDGTVNFKEGGEWPAVSVPNANLFSLYKVNVPGVEVPGADLMIGFRNSIAQSLSAQACIGVSFPICTNISLFGEDLIFRKKNTTNSDLAYLMYQEIQERVLPMFGTVEHQLDRLKSAVWSTVERESRTHQLFVDGALPVKYLKPLAAVFDGSTCPEVEENRWNALGLMHGCTRVIQAEKSLRRQAELSQSVSRHFGFGLKAAA